MVILLLLLGIWLAPLDVLIVDANEKENNINIGITITITSSITITIRGNWKYNITRPQLKTNL